jgi:hypothetical protein
MVRNKIIGISGASRCGKDTLAKIIFIQFPQYKFKRVALADALKGQCRKIIFDKYGLDSFSEKPEEKAVFRQVLVDEAREFRIKSKGKYYMDMILPEVVMLEGIIPIIPDIRYAEYPSDEAATIKSLGGLLIHVKKYSINQHGSSELLGPANEDEQKNDPKVEKLSDIKIVWAQGLTPDNFKTFRGAPLIPHFEAIEKYLSS